MSAAQILDGTAVARRSFADTAERAANFVAAQGRRPCLATVLIGDDPASHTYVRMKQRRAGQVGLESRRVQLSAQATTEEAVAAVRALSEDDTVDGPYYVRNPFDREPGWGVSSINYDLQQLLRRSGCPA